MFFLDVRTVEEFNSRRQHENKNSSSLALVTSFTDGTPLGHVQLNDFVFGANPRFVYKWNLQYSVPIITCGNLGMTNVAYTGAYDSILFFWLPEFCVFLDWTYFRE